MDLQLLSRVLWRFRVLVAGGLLLALTLATLSYGRVEFRDGAPRLTPRDPEVWASEATLLVTQRGFPLGRTITEVFDFTKDPDTGREFALPRFASSSRFSELASIYATLATSDEVLALMLQDGPVLGSVTAEAVRTSDRRTLPLVTLVAQSTSAAGAVDTAKRNIKAFHTYLQREQAANRIAPADRVIVKEIESPRGASIVVPRKLTRPIVVFLTVMIAVLGLAFVLQNLRPSPGVRPAADDRAEEPERLERRQIA